MWLHRCLYVFPHPSLYAVMTAAPCAHHVRIVSLSPEPALPAPEPKPEPEPWPGPLLLVHSAAFISWCRQYLTRSLQPAWAQRRTYGHGICRGSFDGQIHRELRLESRRLLEGHPITQSHCGDRDISGWRCRQDKTGGATCFLAMTVSQGHSIGTYIQSWVQPCVSICSAGSEPSLDVFEP